MLDRLPPTPAQIDDGIAVAANLWALLAGLGGAILGAYGSTLRKGRAQGALETRVAEMEEKIEAAVEAQSAYQTEVKQNIASLSANHERTRDQLADIRATMAQRTDLHSMAAQMTAAMDGIRARINTLLHK